MRHSAAHADLPHRFERLLRADYAAIERGDTTTLRSQLAEDLIWVVGVNSAELTKSQFLAAAGRVQNPPPHFEIRNVREHRIGDVAIVEYERRDRRPIGSGEATSSTRALDVFERRGKRWLLKRHMQSWLISPVTPIAFDPVTFLAFIGHYQIAPGYVDDVHWEEGHLVATASGQTTGATLVPVSVDAFSPDGVGPLMVFERDSSGRVLGYVQGFPDGRVVRATRMR